jgi:aminoglycoside phosphotransferase (APT) family kinase protein
MTPDRAAAEREFTALTTLAEKTRESSVPPLAPLPLVLCREHAVYAMTWVPGRSATQMLLVPSTDLKRAEELGKLTGDWLRRFHACRALPARQSDFAARLNYVGQLVEAAGGQEPMLSRAAGVLVEFASAAAALSMPASWVHGDMKSDNLLVDGSNVTGLDVQLVDDNTVAYDLAPFLNYLCLLRWSPRGAWQRQKLDAMAKAFLTAYSPESANWKLPLLWLRTYLLMQIVAPSTYSSGWRAVASRWPARRELASAIDQIAKYG